MSWAPDQDIATVEQIVCRPFRRSSRYDPSPTARLELIPGRRQEALEQARIFLIGVGAQSVVEQGLLRSGARWVAHCDDDTFEFSNFSRQVGYAADRGKSKAHRVARNNRREAVNGATITSIALPFPEAADYLTEPPTVASCLVDDNECRINAAVYGLEHGIPMVISGLSRDGLRSYSFLQMPNRDDPAGIHPCLLCAFPDLAPVRQPCVAAAIKTVYLVAARILHFIDVAVMGWGEDAEPYNLVFSDLNGRVEGRQMVEQRQDCWLCAEQR